MNKKGWDMKIQFKVVVLTMIGFAMASCQTMKDVTSTAGEVVGDDEMALAKADLDPKQVVQIGRDMSVALVEKYPLVEDDRVISYLNKVGQYVAMHLDSGPKNVKCGGGKEKLLPAEGFRFAALKTDEKIAMSFPGGYVYVSTGMLKAIKRPRLFKRIDFPAPVSPLRIFKPGRKTSWTFSIIAKLETRSSCNISCAPQISVSHAGGGRSCVKACEL